MAWKIEFHPKTEKDLKALGKGNAKRVINFLSERVAPLKDPRSIGEALHGPELGKFWKYRVGPYRIVCDIQDERIIILVVRVGHRKKIYR